MKKKRKRKEEEKEIKKEERERSSSNIVTHGLNQKNQYRKKCISIKQFYQGENERKKEKEKKE